MKLSLSQSLLWVLALSWCQPTLAGEGFANPDDPFEDFNRAMFTFNENLDQYFAKPLAEGYRAITPGPVNRGITRFFANLDDVRSFVNNTLQFKLMSAGSDLARFGINSTIGILGFTDPASEMGLEKHDEDFGQTLGYWGIGPGPYLVWPVIGPSSVRDTAGFGVDWITNPIYWEVDSATASWSLYGVRFVDRRADLLDASEVIEKAALDPYSFMRDAYQQRRQSQVYDGNPPEEDLFNDK